VWSQKNADRSTRKKCFCFSFLLAKNWHQKHFAHSHKLFEGGFCSRMALCHGGERLLVTCDIVLHELQRKSGVSSPVTCAVSLWNQIMLVLESADVHVICLLCRQQVVCFACLISQRRASAVCVSRHWNVASEARPEEFLFVALSDIMPMQHNFIACVTGTISSLDSLNASINRRSLFGCRHNFINPWHGSRSIVQMKTILLVFCMKPTGF